MNLERRLLALEQRTVTEEDALASLSDDALETKIAEALERIAATAGLLPADMPPLTGWPRIERVRDLLKCRWWRRPVTSAASGLPDTAPGGPLISRGGAGCW